MKSVLLSILVLAFTSAAVCAQESLRKKHFNLEKGLAIKGYDPVVILQKIKR